MPEMQDFEIEFNDGADAKTQARRVRKIENRREAALRKKPRNREQGSSGV